MSQPNPKASRRNEPVASNTVAKLDRIYDLRRDCLLNELYYGYRLSLFSRINIWLDVVIVIGSGASGVSGWVIWTTYPQLKAIWAVIAATAILLTALKPVLHIDTRVKHYGILFASYRQLSMNMAGIVDELAEARRVSLELEREVSRVRTRYRAMAADDDPKPSPKLVENIQSEVNKRIPVDSLFYPDETDIADHKSTKSLTRE
jgi:hypothetical protein